MALDPGHIDAVCAWLRAGAGGGTPAVVFETHAAFVFLIGDHAYKLKKAVDLGYLDFSTPARRAAVLQRELELNQAGAPGVYQAVQRVTRQSDGSLAFDGPGEPLEAVLRMRRFDPDAVLSSQPQVVQGDFAEALGRRIAALHGAAPPRPDGGGAGALEFVAQSNAAHLRALPDLAGALAEQVIALTQASLERLAPLLEARREAGFTRRCHGDLHLGNIVVEHGEAVLFDCIEFNDRLSDIDVLYDLAFLLMDLTFRDQRAGAVRVLNGYLDQAARQDAARPYEGLAALPLFLSVRAAVRAHVSAQMGQGAQGRAYLQAALDHLSPPPASLTAIGGRSGSGKSTVARALAPGLGAEPGAVILRTDEIRKRLWGAGPHDRLPAEAYAAEASQAVYAALIAEAQAALQAGRAVILDAVFLKPAERDAAEALAQGCGVPFTGVWLEAPADVLQARVTGRTGDASDANVAVVAAQLAMGAGEIDWAGMDASAAPQETARRILRLPCAAGELSRSV